jgi:predicted ATPase
MDPAATLPAPLTSLVGRDAEVRLTVRLLTGGGSRLVSLVGAAGSGKTRVAVAVGAAAPGPVRFVDMSTMDTQDPAGFVLDAFGVARRPDLSDLDTLLEALDAAAPSGVPLMLVLDNCEHAAAEIGGFAGRLLAVHPRLLLLATSRQPLGLPAETVLAVLPLDPDTALRLFETRMFERTGRPLPREHHPAAAEICAALDGLPLAVELAAARAALLSVPEVKRLLADRFRVLADAKAAGPEHHRTLRAALDWSYQLLSPDKQALLRQLAVFQGGWSEDAVARLPAYRPGLVEALAERSLLTTSSARPPDLDGAGGQSGPAAGTGGHGALAAGSSDASAAPVPATAADRDGERGGSVRSGGGRGRMLQTVAAYAAARLAEHPDESAAAHAAHAAFYLELAEQAAAGVRGPDQRNWLRTLTLEQDNLRAALTSLAGRPGRDGDADLRIAAAMAPFQHFTGGYSQGRQWLADALTRRPDAPPQARVAASSAAATLAMLACDYPAAATLAEQALPLTTADDPAARGPLLTLLGSVERERARYEASLAHLEEARRLYRKSGDAWGEGRATQLAGATAWLSGDLDTAGDLLAASLTAFRDLADAESAASCQTHLGAVAHYRGDQPTARRHLVDALDRFTELAFPEGVAWAQDMLGRVDLADDRLPSAAERLRAALTIHRRVGDRWRTASVLEALSECRRRLGDPAHAAALLGAADVVRHEIAAPTPRCEQPARTATDAALQTALPAAEYARAYRFGTRTPIDDLLTLTGAATLTPTPAP